MAWDFTGRHSRHISQFWSVSAAAGFVVSKVIASSSRSSVQVLGRGTPAAAHVYEFRHQTRSASLCQKSEIAAD